MSMPTLTLRVYLTIVAMQEGVDFFTAVEAVSSTALANPGWDMDQVKSWAEWEAMR